MSLTNLEKIIISFLILFVLWSIIAYIYFYKNDSTLLTDTAIRWYFIALVIFVVFMILLIYINATSRVYEPLNTLPYTREGKVFNEWKKNKKEKKILKRSRVVDEEEDGTSSSSESGNEEYIFEEDALVLNGDNNIVIETDDIIVKVPPTE